MSYMLSPRPNTQPGVLIAAEVGHHERQGRDQPAAFLEQMLALVDGFPGQFDLGVLEIAQPAVDEFGGTAGSTRGKVALLEQDGFQPGTCRLAQDARAGDAAADDD